MLKLHNKTFGILGLGLSGISTIQFLHKNGYKFIAWDDNDNATRACKDKLKKYKIESKICAPNASKWNTIDFLIVSPGIPNITSHKIVKNISKNTKIICDIELFYMHFPTNKYIAVTGTNGKSTTTKLIEHFLITNKIKATACGNIGNPILSVTPSKDEILVVETSSYQLDLIDQFKPNISAILNVTPDHLDRHGSLQAYCDAKKKIFKNQSHGNTLILSTDNDITRDIYQQLHHNTDIQLIPTSTKKPLRNGVSLIKNTLHDNVNKTTTFLPENKNLRGTHNLENIVIAYTAVTIIKEMSHDTINKAITTYPGLPHRLQFLGESNNIEFINDSKATNAESTEKALSSLDGNIFWIAGGLPKEGGIKSFPIHLFKRIKHAFLIGKAQQEFARTLTQHKVPYYLSDTLDKAFKEAIAALEKSKTKSKKTLLLSPACASFDQWKNFEERGNYFVKLVREYSKNK